MGQNWTFGGNFDVLKFLEWFGLVLEGLEWFGVFWRGVVKQRLADSGKNDCLNYTGFNAVVYEVFTM